MWSRVASNCYTVARNTSASTRGEVRNRLFGSRSRTTIQNNIGPVRNNVMAVSISRTLSTNIKTNSLPSLDEVQSYNTDQLCQWLARYSEESNTNNKDANTITNTTSTTTRVFNDQTLVALRGQLIDGAALFNYPSARSIQCSGVQHKQAQRLFDLMQQIKTAK